MIKRSRSVYAEAQCVTEVATALFERKLPVMIVVSRDTAFDSVIFL